MLVKRVDKSSPERLTSRPGVKIQQALPSGSTLDRRDPYDEKKAPWRTYATLLAIVVLAGSWYLGKLDHYLPGFAKSVEVLGKNAPAYDATKHEEKKADDKKAEEKKPDAAPAPAAAPAP